MIALRKAQGNGEIYEFVKEHADDPKGDTDAFNHTLQSIAGRSKPVLKTSTRDRSGG